MLADENGVFTVADLPAGRWTFRAEAMGFRPHALALRVPDSGEIRIEFELKPAPLEISGIEVLTIRTVRTNRASDGARELFNREVVPGAVSVSRTDLGLIPEPVEVDVLQSLQAMPGVVALNGSSALPEENRWPSLIPPRLSPRLRRSGLPRKGNEKIRLSSDYRKIRTLPKAVGLFASTHSEVRYRLMSGAEATNPPMHVTHRRVCCMTTIALAEVSNVPGPSIPKRGIYSCPP